MSIAIKSVLIYAGHQLQNRTAGIYPDSLDSHARMFRSIAEQYEPEAWDVKCVEGNSLPIALEKATPEETLFVVPAGKSADLESFLYAKHGEHISTFIKKGGLFWTTCGGAYAISSERSWHGQRKKSLTPLLNAETIGPMLAPEDCNPEYIHKSVPVKAFDKEISVLLSGGGSFVLNNSFFPTQKIEVVATYTFSKPPHTQNAAVYFEYGQGAGIATMINLQYGSTDFNAPLRQKLYEHKACLTPDFPDQLSKEEDRLHIAMRFIEMLDNRKLSYTS